MRLDYLKPQIDRNRPSRLVLRGEQIDDLMAVVARSAFADAKAGLPADPRASERNRLAVTILGLPGVLPPTPEPFVAPAAWGEVAAWGNGAVIDPATGASVDPYDDAPEDAFLA